MTKITHGDKVTVTTDTINNGEPFEATVLSLDKSTRTVSVEPHSLDVVEMAIVGAGEVKQ